MSKAALFDSAEVGYLCAAELRGGFEAEIFVPDSIARATAAGARPSPPSATAPPFTSYTLPLVTVRIGPEQISVAHAPGTEAFFMLWATVTDIRHASDDTSTMLILLDKVKGTLVLRNRDASAITALLKAVHLCASAPDRDLAARRQLGFGPASSGGNGFNSNNAGFSGNGRPGTAPGAVSPTGVHQAQHQQQRNFSSPSAFGGGLDDGTSAAAAALAAQANTPELERLRARTEMMRRDISVSASGLRSRTVDGSVTPGGSAYTARRSESQRGASTAMGYGGGVGNAASGLPSVASPSMVTPPSRSDSQHAQRPGYLAETENARRRAAAARRSTSAPRSEHAHTHHGPSAAGTPSSSLPPPYPPRHASPPAGSANDVHAAHGQQHHSAGGSSGGRRSASPMSSAMSLYDDKLRRSEALVAKVQADMHQDRLALRAVTAADFGIGGGAGGLQSAPSAQQNQADAIVDELRLWMSTLDQAAEESRRSLERRGYTVKPADPTAIPALSIGLVPGFSPPAATALQQPPLAPVVTPQQPTVANPPPPAAAATSGRPPVAPSAPAPVAATTTAAAAAARTSGLAVIEFDAASPTSPLSPASPPAQREATEPQAAAAAAPSPPQPEPPAAATTATRPPPAANAPTLSPPDSPAGAVAAAAAAAAAAARLESPPASPNPPVHPAPQPPAKPEPSKPVAAAAAVVVGAAPATPAAANASAPSAAAPAAAAPAKAALLAPAAVVTPAPAAASAAPAVAAPAPAPAALASVPQQASAVAAAVAARNAEKQLALAQVAASSLSSLPASPSSPRASSPGAPYDGGPLSPAPVKLPPPQPHPRPPPPPGTTPVALASSLELASPVAAAATAPVAANVPAARVVAAAVPVAMTPAPAAAQPTATPLAAPAPPVTAAATTVTSDEVLVKDGWKRFYDQARRAWVFENLVTLDRKATADGTPFARMPLPPVPGAAAADDAASGGGGDPTQPATRGDWTRMWAAAKSKHYFVNNVTGAKTWKADVTSFAAAASNAPAPAAAQAPPSASSSSAAAAAPAAPASVDTADQTVTLVKGAWRRVWVAEKGKHFYANADTKAKTWKAAETSFADGIAGAVPEGDTTSSATSSVPAVVATAAVAAPAAAAPAKAPAAAAVAVADAGANSTAPLTKGEWTRHWSAEKGKHYYVSSVTKRSTWKVVETSFADGTEGALPAAAASPGAPSREASPAAAPAVASAALAATAAAAGEDPALPLTKGDWTRIWSAEKGKHYYVNSVTKRSTWKVAETSFA
jgi:hypothetical protein